MVLPCVRKSVDVAAAGVDALEVYRKITSNFLNAPTEEQLHDLILASSQGNITAMLWLGRCL